jgi:folate-dependent phosphoribosylglycinamide formyltransferase PurN
MTAAPAVNRSRLAVITSAVDHRVARALGSLDAHPASAISLVVTVVSGSSIAAPAVRGAVAQRGWPSVTIDAPAPTTRAPGWRRELEDTIAASCRSARADIVVMLGYVFLARHALTSLRLVNIHPSVPGGPVGHEGDVIDELLRSRATSTGLTAHVATDVLDRGQPLTWMQRPMPSARRRGWPRHQTERADVARLHGRMLGPFLSATLCELAALDPGGHWPPTGDWPTLITTDTSPARGAGG